MEDKELSHEERLRLISTMINKAKNSYHDTGVGPILWGSVVGICGLVTFMQIRYGLKLPFQIWWLTLVAVVPQIFIAIKESKLNKVKAHDETAMDALWICFGIGIFLLSFININIIDKIKPVFDDYVARNGTRPAYYYSSFSSAFFLLWYGFPTIITGVFRKFPLMLYGGILCWIFCILSVFTSTDIDMLLIAAAAVFAWLIPGIYLRKKFKKENQHHGR